MTSMRPSDAAVLVRQWITGTRRPELPTPLGGSSAITITPDGKSHTVELTFRSNDGRTQTETQETFVGYAMHIETGRIGNKYGVLKDKSWVQEGMEIPSTITADAPGTNIAIRNSCGVSAIKVDVIGQNGRAESTTLNVGDEPYVRRMAQVVPHKVQITRVTGLGETKVLGEYKGTNIMVDVVETMGECIATEVDPGVRPIDSTTRPMMKRGPGDTTESTDASVQKKSSFPWWGWLLIALAILGLFWGYRRMTQTSAPS